MLTFIQNNIDVIIQIMAGIVATASLIASLTPSPKDDGVLLKIRKVVEMLALNVGHASKDK